MKQLPEPDRRPKAQTFLAILKWASVTIVSLTLIGGVFFWGILLVEGNEFMQKFAKQTSFLRREVFGFAPYWTLTKIENVDWQILSTLAYFSLPVGASGTIDRNSYEWQVFEGKELARLFEKAKSQKVKRVVTLTQMDAGTIELFLGDPGAWQRLAWESVEIIRDRGLEGVNIDFEYIPRNDYLRGQFSSFMDTYATILNENLDDPYLTVSVLASSVRFNKIYDIGHLAGVTDGLFMMAYDFYWAGSEEVGPVAPLYGFNDGEGPFWYDVSTAVEDFLKVAGAEKIILGVAYYGRTYAAQSPQPEAGRKYGQTSVTTLEKAQNIKLIATTPTGGWDDRAKVSWRGYYDAGSWQVVYLEDKKSLSYKYAFAEAKKLAGVGIWALGYEGGDQTLWQTLADYLELSLRGDKLLTWARGK